MYNRQLVELEMQKKINRVLESGVSDDDLRMKSVEEIVSEISIYHQELIYQNAELSRIMLQMETLKMRYKSLFEDAPAGYVVYNREGRIKTFNKTFVQMMGISVRRGSTYEFMHFVAPQCQDELYFMINRVLETGKPETIEITLYNGSQNIEVSITSNRLSDPETTLSDMDFTGGEDLLRSVITDITELKNRHEEIVELSLHDPLTGLYNRRFYDEVLNHLHDEKLTLPLSVAMIDIDGLKLINDSFGHLYGDQAILSVSRSLKEFAAPRYLLMRTGGDEIVVLLPGAEEEEACDYMEKTVRQVKECVIEGVSLSFSWGVATKRISGEGLLSVIASAEDAMYSGKMFRSADQKNDTVNVIVQELFSRSDWVREHCRRIADNAARFGKYLGLNDYRVERLRVLGYIHDIGLIGMSPAELEQQDPSTGEEPGGLQRHAEAGYRILRPVIGMADIARMVLFHHENWDGSGVPYGIKEEEIPAESRCIAILDAYDHLRNNPPDGKPMSIKQIAAELESGAGTRFDPKMVQNFVSWLLQEVEKADNC